MQDLKKYYIIPAAPEEVYQALINPATIQLWSGDPAVMSDVPGSEFSLWDDSISGRNIEFIPGKKIVQEWYFGEQDDPSLVTILLHQHKAGTSAELRHTNIPDEDFENIRNGWDENYFGSLIDFYS
jgi:activator of HSP90 ATPase